MIAKESLGLHGEHILANPDGMIAEVDDLPPMGFSILPSDPESPIQYRDWEHYVAVCVTAASRAANVAKVAAEDAAAAKTAAKAAAASEEA